MSNHTPDAVYRQTIDPRIDQTYVRESPRTPPEPQLGMYRDNDRSRPYQPGERGLRREVEGYDGRVEPDRKYGETKRNDERKIPRNELNDPYLYRDKKYIDERDLGNRVVHNDGRIMLEGFRGISRTEQGVKRREESLPFDDPFFTRDVRMMANDQLSPHILDSGASHDKKTAGSRQLYAAEDKDKGKSGKNKKVTPRRHEGTVEPGSTWTPVSNEYGHSHSLSRNESLGTGKIYDRASKRGDERVGNLGPQQADKLYGRYNKTHTEVSGQNSVNYKRTTEPRIMYERLGPHGRELIDGNVPTVLPRDPYHHLYPPRDVSMYYHGQPRHPQIEPHHRNPYYQPTPGYNPTSDRPRESTPSAFLAVGIPRAKTNQNYTNQTLFDTKRGSMDTATVRHYKTANSTNTNGVMVLGPDDDVNISPYSSPHSNTTDTYRSERSYESSRPQASDNYNGTIQNTSYPKQLVAETSTIFNRVVTGIPPAPPIPDHLLVKN